jgi:leukotriene-A4 hydrolase
MVQAVEAMYGPYRWQQYDIFVGPPSFPIGGMENPRLTFATPTILAGDKSLVSLIAHELAHSWSGNLVTNATWSDFWLNEGFTVYLENRIQEKIYGPERAAKERLIEWEDLKREMADLPAADEILHVNLAGRDPDDGFTQVPYIKGAQLLRTIEAKVGRARFDAFLKDYFHTHAFRGITTSGMLQFLRARLPEANSIDLQKWIYEPGLPEGAPVDEGVFAAIDQAAAAWKPGAALRTEGWSTQDWLRFLRRVKLDAAGMAALDEAHKLTATGNFEILTQWLEMSIPAGYAPGVDRVEWFVSTVGRQKMLRPIYRALSATAEGKARAQALFAKARPMYHPLTAVTIENMLK